MAIPLVIGGYTGMKRNLDLDLGIDSAGLVEMVENADQLQGLPPGTRLYFVSNISPGWWPAGVAEIAAERGFELVPVQQATADRLLQEIAAAR